MMVENRVSTSIENDVKNYINMVNSTSQSVTQEYVDRVKNSTVAQASINQLISMEGIYMSDDTSINNTQRAAINASLVAQNSVMNKTNDRTSLATIMESALQQAVEANAELETDQKVTNLLEQTRQNNGGIEGVVGRFADTVTAMVGGGNDSQDVKNIAEASVNMSVDNQINMENHISTNIHKKFESDTINKCKSDMNINQVIEIKDAVLKDRANITNIQDASIDSAVECFNQVYNIREIATETSAYSGQDADVTLDALSRNKTTQDAENTLKQVRLQKNFLDSMSGSCVLVAIIVIGGGMASGGGGGGGDSKGGSSSGKIFGVFLVFFIGCVIYLCVKHREAFKGTALGDKFNELIDELNVDARFKLVLNNDDTYSIFTVDESMQLIMTESKDVHASERQIAPRLSNERNLEFRTVMTESETKFIIVPVPPALPEIPAPPPPTTLSNGEEPGPLEEPTPPPTEYQIFTSDDQFQLVLKYSESPKFVRKDDDHVIIEPVLMQKSTVPADLASKSIFRISPELEVGEEPTAGYTITHVNKNTINTSASGLKLDMVGFLTLSDKPLNGGKFRDTSEEEVEYDINGVEFRFKAQ